MNEQQWAGYLASPGHCPRDVVVVVVGGGGGAAAAAVVAAAAAAAARQAGDFILHRPSELKLSLEEKCWTFRIKGDLGGGRPLGRPSQTTS